MSSTKVWTPKGATGRTLVELLRQDEDKLVEEAGGGFHSFHPNWKVAIGSGFTAKATFRHKCKEVISFRSEAFTTKEDAIADALAKTLCHSSHDASEIDALPSTWRELVRERYDEIQKWTKMPERNSENGAHASSGNGYKIVRKRGGGTHLQLKFTPPPDFTADGKKGLKKNDHLKDTRSNRNKIEAAHAQNKHVQSRERLENASKPDARRKFGDDRTNSSSESSPEASRPPARLKRARAPPAPQLDATAARRGRGAAAAPPRRGRAPSSKPSP